MEAWRPWKMSGSGVHFFYFQASIEEVADSYPTKSPGNKSFKIVFPRGFPKSLKVGSWWGQKRNPLK